MNKKILLGVMVISSCVLMQGMEQRSSENDSVPPQRTASVLRREAELKPNPTAVTRLSAQESSERPTTAHQGGRRDSGEPVPYEGNVELELQIQQEAARRAAEAAKKAAAEKAKQTTE